MVWYCLESMNVWDISTRPYHDEFCILDTRFSYFILLVLTSCCMCSIVDAFIYSLRMLTSWFGDENCDILGLSDIWFKFKFDLLTFCSLNDFGRNVSLLYFLIDLCWDDSKERCVLVSERVSMMRSEVGSMVVRWYKWDKFGVEMMSICSFSCKFIRLLLGNTYWALFYKILLLDVSWYNFE